MPDPSFASSRMHLPVQESAQARRKRRDWRQKQLVLMGLGSYTMDGLLMLAFALLGVVPLAAPLLYFIFGTGTTIGVHRMVNAGWTRHFADPLIVPVQITCHAAVVLPFIVWLPQMGLLLMMLLFVLVGFESVQINLQRSSTWAIGSIVLLSAAGGALLLVMGSTLAFPAANWQQRLVSAIWIALLLLRATLLGLYGARLRGLLSQRNKDLAATFEKLERLASRDELTGALNRRSIMALLQQERQRMNRSGHRFGIALLDVDHFKQVNDDFGHLLGDEVLRRFTANAAMNMRVTDQLGRYGGEEFLLVLSATADEASARAALERIRAGVEGIDWNQMAPGLKVTVSAGLAIARLDESDKQLLSRADAALYAAKRDGRNLVRVG